MGLSFRSVGTIFTNALEDPLSNSAGYGHDIRPLMQLSLYI